MTDKSYPDDHAPLSEAWWEGLREGPFTAPDDVPILAPYEKVRPGFEALVAEALEPGLEYKDLGDGHVELCLWNIFHQGDEDPADGDEDKLKINAMQCALGEPTEDDRFIRIQIACLVRCFWTFPENVDLVIDGIASGRVNLDARVACEPPWNHSILPALRRRRSHPKAGTNVTDSRRPLVRAYIEVLTRWSTFGDLGRLKEELPRHAELAETIYRHLGPPNKIKQLQVERLRFSLGHCAFATLDFRRAWCTWLEMKEVLDAAIRKELGEAEDAPASLTEDLHCGGLCHHAFFRHIDHIIACIGRGARCKLPGAGEEGKRIRGAITNYVHALGSWLANRTEEETVKIWPDSEEVAARIFASLGSHSPRKQWLVASLWKHVQDSQRGAGHGPLTEDPERFAVPETALAV